jgi:hypothetical protein
VKLIELGGNAAMEAYFESFGIPTNAPPNFKYLTKAAQHYRLALLASY